VGATGAPLMASRATASASTTPWTSAAG
jgi:hypothetical protein